MKSLSTRLTLWYALVVTLTVGAAFLVGRVFLEHYLVRGLDLLIEAEFEEIRARLDAQMDNVPESHVLDTILQHAEIDEALYFFQIHRPDGAVVFRSENLEGRQLPLIHGKPWITIDNEYFGRLRVGEFQHNGFDIHIAAGMESIEMLYASYARYSLYASLVVLVLSFGLGFLLSRLALNPIRKIQTSARGISASNFAMRIHVPDTKDEVARMAELLNDMLDRLESAYTQVRRFTAEASHEFRTPLSIIRLQTERMLENKEMPAAERESALAEQMEEVERLNKLIDDLLILAKTDSGVMPMHVKTVDLSSFAEDFAEDARLLASEAGITFSNRVDTTETWNFDPGWIRRVLLNLLSNAIRASSPGTTIQMSLRIKESTLYLLVEDEGPGIPQDQLDSVFERFQQLNSNGDDSGSGLGLAICKSIVQRHEGTIFAVNRPEGGLRVEIQLPRTVPEYKTD